MKNINSIITTAAASLLLFTACRHEIWRQTALPILESGGVVLSARNSLSTEVYQGAGEGLDKAFIRQITTQFTDERYMNPDLTIILTLDDDVREQRIKQRGELKNPDHFESRDRDFQKKVNDGYKQAATDYGYQTIDANRTIDDIQVEIRILFAKLFAI